MRLLGQLDVPVDIDRDAAREAAHTELSRHVYAEAQPPLAIRIIRWIVRWFTELLDRVAAATPGGWYGVVLLLAIVAIAGYAVTRRTGMVRGTAAGRDERPLFGLAPRSAAEHRRVAEAAAATGDWETAVQERFRAVIRTLEERGLIEDRPGRTADEAAMAGGAVLPGSADGLAQSAQTFDSVVYGGKPATPGQDEQLRRLDAAVRTARPFSGGSVPSASSRVGARA
jgi:Domain of unknown function (DUF4129)